MNLSSITRFVEANSTANGSREVRALAEDRSGERNAA
jgi:hypothetical protein